MTALLPQAPYEWASKNLTPPVFGPGIRVMLLAIAVSASAPAWSQAHTSKEGPYTLRASTVSSETIPESTAKAHGIERDPRRGILNVLIQRKNGAIEKTLHGDVHAVARDLTGQKREVPMKEVDANGYVSYMGTYDFVRGEVIDFLIDAKPRSGAHELHLTFRDRMWLVK